MKNTINWITITILALAVAGTFYAEKSARFKTPGSDTPTSTESGLEGEFDALPAILEAIAFCESSSQQFDKDGLVLRGRVNPYDAGMFQINTWYHGRRAKELGINLYTEAGNTEFALLLYEEQGTEPWNASKSCWT